MDCLFCKIVAGEIPAELVFESDTAVAFRDINPQAPTHVLVIPRKHIATINHIDEDDQAIRPAVIWADTRAQAETQALVETIGAARGYDLLGHRLDPTCSLPKMMWLREHDPERITSLQRTFFTGLFAIAAIVWGAWLLAH